MKGRGHEGHRLGVGSGAAHGALRRDIGKRDTRVVGGVANRHAGAGVRRAGEAKGATRKPRKLLFNWYYGRQQQRRCTDRYRLGTGALAGRGWRPVSDRACGCWVASARTRPRPPVAVGSPVRAHIPALLWLLGRLCAHTPPPSCACWVACARIRPRPPVAANMSDAMMPPCNDVHAAMCPIQTLPHADRCAHSSLPSVYMHTHMQAPHAASTCPMQPTSADRPLQMPMQASCRPPPPPCIYPTPMQQSPHLPSPRATRSSSGSLSADAAAANVAAARRPTRSAANGELCCDAVATAEARPPRALSWRCIVAGRGGAGAGAWACGRGATKKAGGVRSPDRSALRTRCRRSRLALGFTASLSISLDWKGEDAAVGIMRMCNGDGG
eukprot:117515-Chlamydomonas_euryale.AAC.2